MGGGGEEGFSKKKSRTQFSRKKYPEQGKLYYMFCINYSIANKKTGSRRR